MRATLALAVLAAAATLPAHAQDGPAAAPAFLTVTGTAELATDYRFRGVSRSQGHPAADASLRVDSAPGFYASAWASSVGGYAGADAEVDLYGGWTRNIGGWTPDAGIYGYLFPGGYGADFYEVYGALSRDLGPASATVGVNYAPPQQNGRDNVYVYSSLSVGVPRTPVTLKAKLGYEDGFEARRKLDWTLGASARRGRFALGLSYVETDRALPRAGAGVVATLSASF